LETLQKHQPTTPVNPRFGTLAGVAIVDLDAALTAATTAGKTTPLTQWKNKWLAKNSDNQFVLRGALETRRIEALADVLQQYEAALNARGLYDFDDMILRAIEVLSHNDDLRYSLHEQYLYIMLDEFQDTNTAQLWLVELLTNNPVSEGRPNVMAVGDDDQAIYAFQGAQYSNMLDFYKLYTDVLVVNLTDNYRSHAEILLAASNVVNQIESRIFRELQDMSKELRAANTSLAKKANIGRHEFVSDVSQYDWLAKQIKQLIDTGTPANEIAVLAPRHRQLEPLVAHLNAHQVPLHYERREDILEAPVVKQLITMARLVDALARTDIPTANALWPTVLSFAFWQFPASSIWQLSWRISSDTKSSWSQALLGDVSFRPVALLFLSATNRVGLETFETILDYLIGNTALETGETDLPSVTSPLREYYLGDAEHGTNPELFYETLSHLTVLRARLRAHQLTGEGALNIADMLQLIDLYQAAEQRMVNTSPYHQQAAGVQLMTVFKAKGLEFEHVFLPAMQDEVWGGSGGSGSNKLTLPANLAPIRHSGANDDERLRILFVALTRAKLGLTMTSYSHNYAGKASRRLKYLDEQEQADGSYKAMVLPEAAQAIIQHTHEAPSLATLELDWRSGHLSAFGDNAQLRALLQDRLSTYQLSPTHLNVFTDLIYGGPDEFFFHILLRFPRAPTPDVQFGNAVHETLEWLQQQASSDSLPSSREVVAHFTARMKAKKLPEARLRLEIERGEAALTAYYKQRKDIFARPAKAELSFRDEGVLISDVHMAGTIDRMEIDKENKTITVVDYKTGKSYSRWASDAKLHKYRQQLYCYKLLIENSKSYRDYTVTSGRLEFIEPDDENHIHSLELHFTDAELDRTKRLLAAMWQRVKALDFPDVSSYPASLTGIRQFEDDLLKKP
jgi:DNA helicase-2/ATP-dependent DNA helicase PcrA